MFLNLMRIRGLHRVRLAGFLFAFGAVISIDGSNWPITIEPSSATVGVGVPVRLAVGEQFGYNAFQWLHNGIPISEATNRVLWITNTTAGDAGAYSVRGTKVFGGDRTSEPARVVVVPAVQFRHLASIPFPGTHITVAVDGERAYVAAGQLFIFDVSDAANPRQLGVYGDMEREIHSVAIYENLPLVVNGSGEDATLELLDISDPAHPKPISQTLVKRHGVDILVRDDQAYVAALGAFQIADLSPGSNSLLSEVGPFNAFAVDVAGDVAYVGAINNGIQIVDIAEPAAPRVFGQIKGGFVYGVNINGDRLYTAGDWLSTYDISVPEAPRLIGERRRLHHISPRANPLTSAGDFVLTSNASYPGSPVETGAFL